MSFCSSGYELIDGVVSDDVIRSILHGFNALGITGGGLRNAEKKLVEVLEYAESRELLGTASKYLDGQPRLVRAILFDKTEDSNWLVTWHQDKTVSVSTKFGNSDWGPWSEKDGVLHVQAPSAVLNEMVTFRVHLDDSTKENGCLKVIPGSHREGVMSQARITEYTKGRSPIYCEASKGSALVMRPHILHASSKSTCSSPRRVLHLEYSSYQLPQGVAWA